MLSGNERRLSVVSRAGECLLGGVEWSEVEVGVE